MTASPWESPPGIILKTARFAGFASRFLGGCYMLGWMIRPWCFTKHGEEAGTTDDSLD